MRGGLLVALAPDEERVAFVALRRRSANKNKKKDQKSNQPLHRQREGRISLGGCSYDG